MSGWTKTSAVSGAIRMCWRNPITAKMVSFLAGIGLEVEPVELVEKTFLPGITIREGTLLIDESRLTWPGDILHEAGHLAILPAAKRKTINGDAGSDPGYEMTAMAWSYAAALHLHLDPALVFHSGGYLGSSQAILENFAMKRYFGVPVLQWLGMTLEPKTAIQEGLPAYPHMTKWVLD